MRHVDLTVHNTVLLDIWWNMLIKFSKQTAKTFVKVIIGYQVNQKSVKHLRWSFFRKFLLDSESWQTFKMELLAKPKTKSKTKIRSLFLQKSSPWLFDKVLNILLNWHPKLTMFYFSINLPIKCSVQPSAKKNQKERPKRISK